MACEIFGAVRSDQGEGLDESLDIGVALLPNPFPKSRRVGVLTAGGGWGVLPVDSCAEVSFDVVLLPEGTLVEADRFLPSWWNRGNPVDLVVGSW